MTLREWFPQAIAARPRASAELKHRYVRMLENWVPEDLMDRPMDTITEVEAGQWVSWLLAQGLSAKTVHNVSGTISSVVKQAMRAEVVRRNVFVGLGAGLRDDPPERVFLEPDEFELVRCELQPHLAELATFLYWTGMRFGEATALQWRDIDYRRSTVRVNRSWKRTEDNSYVLGKPKTKNSVRTIVVTPEILTALHERDPGQPPHDSALTAVDAAHALVFTHDGQRVTQSVFYQVHWQPAVKRAQANGLSKTPRVHDLRHSHASYLLDRGIDILNVSHRLGHSSVAVTGDIYGHRSAGADARILAAMADTHE